MIENDDILNVSLANHDNNRFLSGINCGSGGSGSSSSHHHQLETLIFIFEEKKEEYSETNLESHWMMMMMMRIYDPFYDILIERVMRRSGK